MTGMPDAPARPAPRGWRRAVLLALAGLFFGLAAVGAVLPGLPTTPFLLLTSWLLVRSSPRLNEALLRSRLFGRLLRDWQERRGVRRAVKVRAVVVIVAVASATALLSDSRPAARLGLLALSLVGVAVVARLPVVREPGEPGEPGEGPVLAAGRVEGVPD